MVKFFADEGLIADNAADRCGAGKRFGDPHYWPVER